MARTALAGTVFPEDVAQGIADLAEGRPSGQGGTQNLLHPMRGALAARATLGEVSDALRDVFGEYRPG